MQSHTGQEAENSLTVTPNLPPLAALLISLSSYVVEISESW